MLGDILRIINEDGYISRFRLAGKMNISKGLVDEGINQLLRRGYLLADNTGEGCSAFCTRCPFANNCGRKIVKVFRISAKGSGFLKRFEKQPSG